ncbi:MAG: hypothetical protein R3D80_18380 [Paracoccaceae bacterium]
MTISKELLDELLKGVERPEDLLGEAGLMKELKIKLMERMLGAELTAHLGYEEGKEVPPGQGKLKPERHLDQGAEGTGRRDAGGGAPRPRQQLRARTGEEGQTWIDGMDDKIIHCLAGDLQRKSAERGLYAAG